MDPNADLVVNQFFVGITGHRYLGQAVDFVANSLRDRLCLLYQTYSQRLVALSAIAEGADTLFAEAALSLEIPLEVVIPFKSYCEDFLAGLPRERFTRLLSVARHVYELPHTSSSNLAYRDAGFWIVNRSNLLIVVWNEMPSRGIGGTGDVVDYALTLGKPLIIIDPVSQAIKERLLNE
jgi:hypothetical protein